MTATIHIGDALATLRALPTASVHCCVTSKNARTHRPAVVDARGEVLRFDQRDMVHRFTGEVRMVNTCGDHVVFVNGHGRCIRRSCRKALAWIRNAEVLCG